jgi:hypothetical protein
LGNERRRYDHAKDPMGLPRVKKVD